MGKIGKNLFLKLRPISAGNHGHLHNTQQRAEQFGHLGIERDALLSASVPSRSKTMSLFIGQVPSGSEISNKLMAPPWGRHKQAPTTAGKSSTSPLPRA